MRFFFTLTAVFAIALSVNAAFIFDKRAAPNVESCVSNINSISTHIDTLQNAIQKGGFVDTTLGYDDVQKALSSAQSSCCAINAAVSDPDADYFLDAVGNLTPKVQSVLSVLAGKASNYNIISSLLIETRIKDLDKSTNALNTCLVVFTPPSKAPTLQGYIDKIKAALVSTRAAYNM